MAKSAFPTSPKAFARLYAETASGIIDSMIARFTEIQAAGFEPEQVIDGIVLAVTHSHTVDQALAADSGFGASKRAVTLRTLQDYCRNYAATLLDLAEQAGRDREYINSEARKRFVERAGGTL